MHALPNLPPAIARQIFATLCAALPLPATDTPEARAARDEAAMAAVAALQPADASEAQLAALIVAADAHANDCLRRAVQPGQQPEDVRRCRARAASMMRQVQGGLRDLRRTQAMRTKAQARVHPAARQRAGTWSRDVVVPGPVASPGAVEPTRQTKAARYAAIYRKQGARGLAQGGWSARLDFRPRDPEFVAAQVTGTGSLLRARDRPPARRRSVK